VEFLFAPFFDPHCEVDVTQGDIFLTTSWWTTKATLCGVHASKVIYLLQEDERMFYPYGDDRVSATEVMSRRDIQFLVNTKLLFDHLVLEGFDNFKTCAQWFEPSFSCLPSMSYKKPEDVLEKVSKQIKRRFFFYARPNNPRNLFYLGLQVIDQAIREGVLDPDLWELVFVGKDIPAVVFCGDVVPTRIENLSWQDYMSLVSTIDLGLALMATPHPSYPPFDLASAGAVVVTNRFGVKTDLSMYSPNILCVEPELKELVMALRRAVSLTLNEKLRAQNQANNNFIATWESALSGVIEGSLERLHVSN
jgi:hypothetical protein